MKGLKRYAAMAAIALMATSAQAHMEQADTDSEFSGRVIGLIACNNNQSVVVTLRNDGLQEMKSFITEAAPRGFLNPVLAEAYVSVGLPEEKKVPLTVTYNADYTGETCGNPNVKGYWTGYAK